MPTKQKVYQVTKEKNICSSCKREEARQEQRESENTNRGEVATGTRAKVRCQLVEAPNSEPLPQAQKIRKKKT